MEGEEGGVEGRRGRIPFRLLFLWVSGDARVRAVQGNILTLCFSLPIHVTLTDAGYTPCYSGWVITL